MHKKILLSSIAALTLSACGSGPDDPKYYTGLDLSGAQSLVLKRVNETATGIATSQSRSGEANIDAESILYKVTENGLEEVTFLDEEEVSTTISYQADCVKNINDDFFATYSRQHIPLQFTLTDENGEVVKTQQNTTKAILIVRKSDGKVFPYQDNSAYINGDGDYICTDIITSADLWALPHNTVLLKSVADGTAEDMVGKETFELLVELSDNESLASNRFTLPGESSTNVIISPNAYGYEVANSFRIIGDSYQASGRLVEHFSSEYEILRDVSFSLPDGKNYRRYLDRLTTDEHVYTGEIDEVLTEVTLTSDAQVIENEVYRSSYKESFGGEKYGYGLIYRYPASDLFLDGNCRWYEYDGNSPQKLAFRDSTAPNDLINLYGEENISCNLMQSETNVVSYPNYANHEGYLSFLIHAEDNKYLAQYNPHTKDRLILEYPAHALQSYDANIGELFPVDKGLFQFDGAAYNNSGDLVNLYFDLTTGEVTDTIEQENDSGYFWVAPMN